MPLKGPRPGLRPLLADHQREDRPAAGSSNQPGGAPQADQVFLTFVLESALPSSYQLILAEPLLVTHIQGEKVSDRARELSIIDLLAELNS